MPRWPRCWRATTSRPNCCRAAWKPSPAPHRKSWATSSPRRRAAGAASPSPPTPRPIEFPRRKDKTMTVQSRPIGLAIIGAGRVGLFRGEVAARHPLVKWIGIAEIKPDRAKEVAGRIGADFVTSDFRELLKRPEVNAAIIATDEHLHVEPILAACERKLPLLIEKPLAPELADSAKVLKAIQ